MAQDMSYFIFIVYGIKKKTCSRLHVSLFLNAIYLYTPTFIRVFFQLLYFLDTEQDYLEALLYLPLSLQRRNTIL